MMPECGQMFLLREAEYSPIRSRHLSTRRGATWIEAKCSLNEAKCPLNEAKCLLNEAKRSLKAFTLVRKILKRS
jgi:hypothetical protein